jgi:glutathione S-transferase
VGALTLYRSTSNSCATATHIALEEAGADYKAIRIDIGTGDQHKPEFLKVNPKARVPALVTPQGILTENVALLAYIAQTHPKANLAPTDAYGFARMQAFNAWLSSTVHVAHAHKVRGSRWSDDAAAIESMKAKVAANMTACAELIEKEYLQGPWVMGDHFTVADCYLYVNTGWMIGDGVDLSKLPKLTAHYAAMNQRASVKEAMAGLM